MDRRQFLGFSSVVGLTVALSGCGLKIVDISYLEKILNRVRIIEKAELRRHIKGIQENMVTLETTTEYIGGYIGISAGFNTHTFSGEGLIYRDYILTADHVINLTKKTVSDVIKEHLGRMFDPEKLTFEKINEHTLLDGEVVNEQLNYPEKDMGIILYKKPKRSDYVVELGDSDKVDLLDELYVIGRPHSRYPIVKGGIVGSGERKGGSLRIESGIITDHRAISGDSGSPLINLDGEVVGITSHIIEGSHTISVPINLYKEAIAEYENSLRRDTQF